MHQLHSAFVARIMAQATLGFMLHGCKELEKAYMLLRLPQDGNIEESSTCIGIYAMETGANDRWDTLITCEDGMLKLPTHLATVSLRGEKTWDISILDIAANTKYECAGCSMEHGVHLATDVNGQNIVDIHFDKCDRLGNQLVLYVSYIHSSSSIHVNNPLFLQGVFHMVTAAANAAFCNPNLTTNTPIILWGSCSLVKEEADYMKREVILHLIASPSQNGKTHMEVFVKDTDANNLVMVVKSAEKEFEVRFINRQTWVKVFDQSESSRFLTVTPTSFFPVFRQFLVTAEQPNQ